MTTPVKTKPAPAYRSGHCALDRPLPHRCAGAYGGATCSCECHRPCDGCGQPWPRGVPRD